MQVNENAFIEGLQERKNTFIITLKKKKLLAQKSYQYIVHSILVKQINIIDEQIAWSKVMLNSICMIDQTISSGSNNFL